MPWTDLNALLGLPPEDPNPRRISALSASLLPGDLGQRPAVDIGEVGPSQPRMAPDSEDFIGQAGPMPGQGWVGGSVQGMPGVNIGEVGDPPRGPVSTPKSDMAAFGPLTSTLKSARLPMPPGFDQLAAARDQAGTGGAAGQAKAEDVRAAGETVTPVQAASARPVEDISELHRKKAMASILAERGTPAQRVRGKLTLYEVEKKLKEIEEGQAEAKQLGIIESSMATPEGKSKAATLAKLGAKTNEIAEALGFDDKGVAREKERTEKLGAYVGARANDARVGSTLKQAATRAFKIIDENWLATGTPGAVSGVIPGSAAANLRKVLEPIQANIGFDRLQQMRDQSKTGGALGSIAVRELEFLQAVQGSLDITQSPQTLKENIAAILKSQQIFANMRKLVPGIEAGDPEAIEAYAALSGQLGTLDADVSRMLASRKKLPPRPQGVDDQAILRDAQEAMKRATPEQRDEIGRQLLEWGVDF